MKSLLYKDCSASEQHDGYVVAVLLILVVAGSNPVGNTMNVLHRERLWPLFAWLSEPPHGYDVTTNSWIGCFGNDNVDVKSPTT